MTDKQGVVRVEGRVEEALPALDFRVRIMGENGEERDIIAHLAGRLKIHRIRVVPGDRVTVELPNAKEERGRIVRRL
jgi:translation initiation factor IF-1